MRVRKITSLQKQLCYLLFLMWAGTAFAQPTVSGVSPSVVTFRTIVTITGTNFTPATASTLSNVQFKAASSSTWISSTAITYVNATTLRAAVPSGIATSSTVQTATNLRVTNASGTSATYATNFYYKAPAATPAVSTISRIITNYGGYWSSGITGSGYATNTTLPDGNHSLMAFRYNGTLYSTGSESAITDVLGGTNATTTGTYTTGNWRALPISNIAGVVPNSGDPNLIVLASMVDGSANSQVPTAPTVAGLKIRDVLIDGTRGLNLGSGVTNLPSSSVFEFQAQNVQNLVVNDGIPDVMVSQIATPSANSFSVYCFIDANGDIVGNPVQIQFGTDNSNVLGNYKSDFFTLPIGQPLNTATVNGSLVIGGNTRPIRMVAYQLSDFGITEDNKGQVARFKVMPSGTSDPAFMAYNRNSFQIPAPEITAQPASSTACPGGQASFQVTVGALDGAETPTYQWMKNGVAIQDVPGHIAGTQTATLTITNIVASDAGAYRCLITNTGGSALSNNAYLNSVVGTGPDVATCAGTATTMEVSALGNTPQYQWYQATGDNNNTGSAINGATSATYTPPASLTANTYYFYAKVRPSAQSSCPGADVASDPIEYTVLAAANGGVVSDYQYLCPGSYATITVSEYTGNSVQWYSSTSPTGTFTIINNSTANGNTATLPALYQGSITETTYYRAQITGSCGTVNSPVTAVVINDTYIWTGAVSQQWNNTGNWTCNTIPTLLTNVIIPAGVANYPRVGTLNGYAKTVTIEEGASITVNAGGKLQVDDTFTAAAGTTVTVTSGGTLEVKNAVSVATTSNFVVENNAALVQINSAANTGKITVKRNSNSLYRLDYTYWSSPVEEQNVFNFSPATATNPMRFYTYVYDGTLEWYLQMPNPSINFEAARGYLIRMPNTDTLTNYNQGLTQMVYPGKFVGKPHNGNYSPSLYITNSLNQSISQAGHYYGVGNPYPSPISVASFYNDTDNQSKIAAGSALYFWRKRNDSSVSSYASLTLSGFAANAGNGQGMANTGGQINEQFYPASGVGSNNYLQYIISPGQGFLVKLAAGATSNVTFKNSMRVAATTTATATGGQPFFRTAQDSEPSRFWINMGDATGGYSQALVAYSEEGTLDVDYGYDGFEINAGSSIRLYSKQGENNFTIQSRPNFEPTDVVKMGYTVTAAGEYNINLHDKDGVFIAGQQIYLKDNLLGTTHDFANGAYYFNTVAGAFADRFEVVYVTEALGTIDAEAGSVYVYKQNGTNTINVTSGQLELTGIKVFDIRGRELYNGAANGNQASVSLNIAQQVVIVEVNTTAGKVSKKIIF